MIDRRDLVRAGCFLAFVALGACGPAETGSTLPDESLDLAMGSGGMGPTLANTEAVTPEIAGTEWQWLEAHCTEGPLDLRARGFAQQARISVDANGLLIAYDQTFATEACVQTIMQRAKPGAAPDDEWQMSEEAHVALPQECGNPPERDRPGNVRMRGDKLEVYVQRSNWCEGFEVRMVYEQLPPTPLDASQLARHYAGHFSRRDLDRLSGLFAVTGSLVEPFTESATGVTRHDGRPAVRAWYGEAFANVPWLAMRLTGMEAGREEGQVVSSWEYMDPRIAEPFTGRNHFTTGGGEIFETRIELTGEPKPAAAESTSEEGGDE